MAREDENEDATDEREIKETVVMSRIMRQLDQLPTPRARVRVMTAVLDFYQEQHETFRLRPGVND